MAEEKKGFPMLPVAHWWSLRKKFTQSIPGVVTDSYLATVLNMGANSARANVLPFLKTLGIIDEEGRPKERAKLWRDNMYYAEVCKAILKEVYPEELLDAVPDPRQERDAARRWFASHTGAGEAACNRMAVLYTVLMEANPSSESDFQKGQEGAKTRKPPRPRPALNETKPPSATAPEKRDSVRPAGGTPQAPSISINLQIHISADASNDQIEQIFAAMAKHIYMGA